MAPIIPDTDWLLGATDLDSRSVLLVLGNIFLCLKAIWYEKPVPSAPEHRRSSVAFPRGCEKNSRGPVCKKNGANYLSAYLQHKGADAKVRSCSFSRLYCWHAVAICNGRTTTPNHTLLAILLHRIAFFLPVSDVPAAWAFRPGQPRLPEIFRSANHPTCLLADVSAGTVSGTILCLHLGH